MIEVRGCVTVSVMLGIHVGSSGSREAGAGGRRFFGRNIHVGLRAELILVIVAGDLLQL